MGNLLGDVVLLQELNGEASPTRVWWSQQLPFQVSYLFHLLPYVLCSNGESTRGRHPSSGRQRGGLPYHDMAASTIGFSAICLSTFLLHIIQWRTY